MDHIFVNGHLNMILMSLIEIAVSAAPNTRLLFYMITPWSKTFSSVWTLLRPEQIQFV